MQSACHESSRPKNAYFFNCFTPPSAADPTATKYICFVQLAPRPGGFLRYRPGMSRESSVQNPCTPARQFIADLRGAQLGAQTVPARPCSRYRRCSARRPRGGGSSGQSRRPTERMDRRAGNSPVSCISLIQKLLTGCVTIQYVKGVARSRRNAARVHQKRVAPATGGRAPG
jgi:hypothetical protein